MKMHLKGCIIISSKNSNNIVIVYDNLYLLTDVGKEM